MTRFKAHRLGPSEAYAGVRRSEWPSRNNAEDGRLATVPCMTLVALAGNPNTGKSTLFNSLTGARQKVANFPGVTVEKKEGACHFGGKAYRIIDLPGLYSLNPSSVDEWIAASVVLGTLENCSALDGIVVVLNSLALDRGLFLIAQLRDLDIPLGVVVNMMDTARKSGRNIDLQKLSALLGVPVVGTVASRSEGIEQLRQALAKLSMPQGSEDLSPLSTELRVLIGTIEKKICVQFPAVKHVGYWAKKVVADYSRHHVLSPDHFPFNIQKLGLESELSAVLNDDKNAWIEFVRQRHNWARAIAQAVIQESTVSVSRTPQAMTDRIDRVCLHPVLGPLIFLGIMGVLFQSIFTWAAPLMDLIDSAVRVVSNTVSSVLPEGLIQSFWVDGVISGVGNVVIFVPQIMILFGFITVLEDSGYLSRASFLLDRLLVKTGLGGKSFIPLLSSFACAIPGIMATRHIEDRKERLITIMVAPLMTCSARLPVYALLVGAFVPVITVAGVFNLQGLVFLGLYLLGIGGAACVAWTLKKIWMKQESSFYVSELPLYRLPGFKTVLQVMVQRGRIFVLKAGKIILVCTIVLWFLAAFPRHEQMRGQLKAQGYSDTVIQSERLAHSYIGQLGHWIEPVIRPLGFDWKIGVGLISSFAAREVMVSTMATLHSMGDADENSVSLKEALRNDHYPSGEPVFTIPVALSLLVFFVFAMQCMSTLAVTRRETSSWKHPSIMFVYMTLMAYGASFVVYRLAGVVLS